MSRAGKHAEAAEILSLAGVPRNPEPQPASKPAPSPIPFPTPDDAMFYGLAGEIVQSVDPYTEACRPAVQAHLMSGCGAMIGRGPHLSVGFTKHPTSIWAVIVGGTSLGAKGTAEATARAFLAAADRDFMTSRVLPAVSTGEGLIHHVRDESEELGRDGCPVDEGVPDKRLLVFLPEFRTVMAQARRDNSTLSPTLRQAWDSQEILAVPNRNAPYKATGAHIVMVAHVTPGEFRTKIDPAEIAGGLLNRYLIVASRSSKDLPNPERYPANQLTEYGQRLSKAIDFARGLGNKRLDLTGAAQELWGDNYSDLKNPTCAKSEEEEGLVAGVVTRARPHVLRLALTYALLDQCQAVDEQHLAAALAFWRYSLTSAKWLFRSPANSTLDRLRAFIDGSGGTGRTKEEIRRGVFAGHVKAADLDALLAQLGDDYAPCKVPTGGRSREVYRRTPSEEGEKREESRDQAQQPRAS